jgi:hypothetical protein
VARPISRKRVLAKSQWCSGWVLGTLYVHPEDLRFEPEFSLRTTIVATHLPWARVSAVRLGGALPFGTVEVVHRGGVEIYRCFGAGRLAELMEAGRASVSPTQVAA